jgi:CheY-specific phosphatase CheX
MEAALRKAVIRSLTEVFEKMFFTILVPSLELEAASEDEYLEAVIAYRGSREGNIRLCFPEALAIYITQNFTGKTAGQLTEALVLDTVRETANVTVGSLLGELCPRGICNLGIPVSRRCDGFSIPAAANHPGACAFDSGMGVLWFIYEEERVKCPR